MRPGLVVTIRVNPKDCMAVVDVIRKTGMDIPGASFASLVSLTLGSLLQMAREAELIPTRDGFEYSEMMQSYEGTRSRRRKLEIANALRDVGRNVTLRTLKPAEEMKQELNTEQRNMWTRLRELGAKLALSTEDGSGVIFSAADQEEYDRLLQLV